MPATLRIGLAVMAMGLYLWGCHNPRDRHSAIFKAIFGENLSPANDTFVFRKVHFGQSMEEIAKAETGDPKYNDFFGLSYELPTVEGANIQVLYYQNPTEKGGVASILVEADLPDEFVAVSLYREIEEYMNLRYGPPKGFQGNYSWESEEKNTTAFLQLTDAKRRVLLNFLPIIGVKPPIDLGDSATIQLIHP